MDNSLILEENVNMDNTENKSSSKSQGDSCMEKLINTTNIEFGQTDYIMYRYTFNSQKGCKSDLTDKVLIAKRSNEICDILKKHINKIFCINGLSLGIEEHSSKGKLKGELCAEHIHIHLKGTFKVLTKINNYKKKYDNIKNEINSDIKSMMAMALKCEKTLFNSRSCIKIGADACCDRDRKQCIKDDPECIMSYPQKFYKKYSVEEIYNPWNKLNDDLSYPLKDVIQWRNKGIILWESSFSKHKARQLIEENIDLKGWWYDIYNLLDESNCKNKDDCIKITVQYYKKKCSRGFSEKEIIERLKTYLLSRGLEEEQKYINKINSLW